MLDIGDDYGWVLLIEVLLAFHCFLNNFLIMGRARGKYFTKSYLETNFINEYNEAFGRNPDGGGYPDMGTGRLSEKLTFAEWYNFNNSVRAANNFIEQIFLPLVCIPIAGIHFDLITVAIAVVYMLFRIVYSVGYVRGGANKRLVGALGSYLCLMGLIGLGIASAMIVQFD